MFTMEIIPVVVLWGYRQGSLVRGGRTRGWLRREELLIPSAWANLEKKRWGSEETYASRRELIASLQSKSPPLVSPSFEEYEKGSGKIYGIYSEIAAYFKTRLEKGKTYRRLSRRSGDAITPARFEDFSNSAPRKRRELIRSSPPFGGNWNLQTKKKFSSTISEERFV